MKSEKFKIKDKKKAFKMFDRFEEVLCATSTREVGSISKQKRLQKNNLKTFADLLGIKSHEIVFMKQIHGARVEFVSKSYQKAFPETDGMITDKKGIFLGTVTADCLPVTFYDSQKNIIGVAHAGYRGILVGVLPEVVAAILGKGGSTQNIQVEIGPSICVACYSVDQSRASEFISLFGKNVVTKKNGECFLDLKKAALIQLKNVGVLEKNITISKYCTSCDNDLFFSYRKDGKETYGEQVTIVGVV